MIGGTMANIFFSCRPAAAPAGTPADAPTRTTAGDSTLLSGGQEAHTVEQED